MLHALSDTLQRTTAFHFLGECSSSPRVNFSNDAARVHDMSCGLADKFTDMLLW